MIRRIITALAAMLCLASPALAQIDPVARGLAAAATNYAPRPVAFPASVGSPTVAWSTQTVFGYQPGFALSAVNSANLRSLSLGFVEGVEDSAELAKFQGTAHLLFTKGFDQSGNGYHLGTAGTGNNSPVSGIPAVPLYGTMPFDSTSPIGQITSDSLTLNGAWGVTIDNWNQSTVPVYVTIPQIAGLNRNNYTVLFVAQPLSSRYGTFTEWCNGGSSEASVLYMNSAGGGGLRAQGSHGTVSGLMPRSSAAVFGYSDGPAGELFEASDRVVNAGLQQTSQALTGTGTIGFECGNTNGGELRLYGFYLWPYTMTSAELLAAAKALEAAYGIPTSFVHNLVLGGSSLIFGQGGGYQGQTGGIYAGLGMVPLEGWPSSVEVYNLSVSGQTLATQLANWANFEKLAYDPDVPSNVIMLDADSNGISGGQTDAQSIATLASFIAAIKADSTHPWKIVVPTIIPRGAFLAGGTPAGQMETYRLNINAWIRANAASLGYTVADRAGDPIMGGTATLTNITYMNTDQTHPTTLGYVLIAAIDKAAIMAAW